MSRSLQSLKNGKVSLIFFIVSFILSFISRAIFIKTLGADLLGLNTVLIGIIGYLNLAEMGVGPAISYSLYKPIKEKNTNTINEIITLQGWFYKWIAGIIIFGALILMLFFPKIFKDSNVPLHYAYITFVVLLIANLLGYYYNYKQIVFTADMQQYILTRNVQGPTIIKVILQIGMVYFMPNPYLWWVGLEFLFAVFITLNISRITKKYYPWVTKSNVKVKSLRVKYNEIIKNTKNIFVHHLSTVVTEKTDNLIIFSIATLSIITKYNNYIAISAGIVTLVSVIFAGIRDAIGNLISEGVTKNNIMFFFEFTSVKFFIASIICCSLYFLYDDFITIWVGKQFVISNMVKLGILANLFISIARSTDFFLAGYGLFRDVWAVILEIFLCILLALILGNFYGVAGVVWGFFLGKFPVIYLWKPYFLFSAGFNTSVKYFYKRHFYYIILMFIPCLALYIFNKYSPVLFTHNIYFNFLFKSVMYVLALSIIAMPLFIVFLPEFKKASLRMINTITKKQD